MMFCKTWEHSLPEAGVRALCLWRDSHWYRRGCAVLDLTCTSRFCQSQLALYGTCQDHQPPVFLALALSRRCLGSCQGWVLCHLSYVSSFIPHQRPAMKERRLLLLTSGLHLAHSWGSQQVPTVLTKLPVKPSKLPPHFPTPSHSSAATSALCWTRPPAPLCPHQHHRVTWAFLAQQGMDIPWSTV